MPALLKAENISRSFREGRKSLVALDNINLKVEKGEFLVLLGPSGSGKSTLLRILSGLIQPTTGKITKTPKLRQSFIFQDFALFPWLNVYDNVAFGLKMQNTPAKIIHKIVSAEIERMGLKGFEHQFPRELSGGMKQRVGIARALVMQPQILFLDEPFSALDSFTAHKLRQELLDVWKENKLTVIMVTHLIEEAIELGDTITVLSPRPGQIEMLIKNELPRPRDPRSKKLFALSDRILAAIKF